MNEFYSIAKENKKPDHPYQLVNLGSQRPKVVYSKEMITSDFWGEVQRNVRKTAHTPTRPEHYDLEMAHQLMALSPIYDVDKMLDYHLDFYVTENQGTEKAFYKHIKYVVFPLVKKYPSATVTVQLMEEWLTQLETRLQSKPLSMNTDNSIQSKIEQLISIFPTDNSPLSYEEVAQRTSHIIKDEAALKSVLKEMREQGLLNGSPISGFKLSENALDVPGESGKDYILRKMIENEGTYNFVRLDGTKFKNELEKFKIIEILEEDGQIIKSKNAIGNTYRLTTAFRAEQLKKYKDKVINKLNELPNEEMPPNRFLEGMKVPGLFVADLLELLELENYLIIGTRTKQGDFYRKGDAMKRYALEMLTNSNSHEQEFNEPARDVFSLAAQPDKVDKINYIDLINRGESNRLEFKSTLRVDLKTDKAATFIEDIIIKTIASFLNSEGGILLIGVDDEKKVLGLDKDFNTFTKPDKLDEFQKHLDNLVGNKIGNRFYRYLDISFPQLGEKVICSIIIKKKSREPLWVKSGDSEKFYIRRSASTIELKGSDAVKYILEHFSSQHKEIESLSAPEKIDMYSNEGAFNEQMQHILEDRQSAYYRELKDHWNSYSLLENAPLLTTIISDFLTKSIQYGLLPCISDFTRKHLNHDKEAKYIYNQPHIYSHNAKNEGYDLHIYYHIRFIGLLYNTAILNRVDIDVITSNKKSMNSIFSGMIERMISHFDKSQHDDGMEYPSNYHWLIGEIFSMTGNWLDTFIDPENFISKSSYTDYIPSVINDCFEQLYQGEEKGKVPPTFIIHHFYHAVLCHYFAARIQREILDSMEEMIISHIPDRFVIPVLKYALNEAFAVRYSSFTEGKWHVNNDRENSILHRLRNFLVKSQKL